MQKVELFKPDDFDGAECYSNYANKKLQEYLESCPVAYFKYLGGNPFNIGPELNKEDDTHVAYLAFAKEIYKKPCEHTLIVSTQGSDIGRCQDCGVEMIKEWKVKP